ncbi:aromatic acid exporter family protein [Curtobacterium flaccumfaciens]|nr:aromatic acid exporter family protein [Curtobacterium flaccumfaciens]
MNPVARLRSSSRTPFLQVVKTAVAVVAAVLLCRLVIQGPFPTFAAIAALLVVQPSINQSFVKGLERSAGVVIGVVLATGFHLLLGDGVFVVLLVIVLAILIAWALRLTPTSATQVGISGMLVLTAGVVTPNYSADRILGDRDRCDRRPGRERAHRAARPARAGAPRRRPARPRHRGGVRAGSRSA